ncbi:hypothetical protein KR038_007306 [Drosophila bunnanda]|nr:hypothetical protein KR038_007306 [Drosophila bunnanda]
MVQKSWLKSFTDDEKDDNELLMTLVELSISLGDYSHDVLNSLAILKQPPSPALVNGPSEFDLIERFQQKFIELSDAADEHSSNVQGDYFMQAHKHLQDLEPDELKRIQLLDHLYQLFDAAHPTVATPYQETVEELLGW